MIIKLSIAAVGLASILLLSACSGNTEPSCVGGGKERGMIFGGGTWDKGNIKGSKAMKEAYEMGKKV